MFGQPTEARLPQDLLPTHSAVLRYSTIADDGNMNTGGPYILHIPSKPDHTGVAAGTPAMYSLVVDVLKSLMALTHCPITWPSHTKMVASFQDNCQVQARRLQCSQLATHVASSSHRIQRAGHAEIFVASQGRDSQGAMHTLEFESQQQISVDGGNKDVTIPFVASELALAQEGAAGGILSHVRIAMPTFGAGHGGSAIMNVEIENANCRSWLGNALDAVFDSSTYNTLFATAPLIVPSGTDLSGHCVSPAQFGQNLRLQFVYSNGAWKIADKVIVMAASNLNEDYFAPPLAANSLAAYDAGALSTDAEHRRLSAFNGTAATMPIRHPLARPFGPLANTLPATAQGRTTPTCVSCCPVAPSCPQPLQATTTVMTPPSSPPTISLA